MSGGKPSVASAVVGSLAGSGNTRWPLHAVGDNGGGVPSTTHTSRASSSGSLSTTVEPLAGWVLYSNVAGVHWKSNC